MTSCRIFTPHPDPNHIYTTIGVYNSHFQYSKYNGVIQEHIYTHILYNTEMRWGRALFVDGKCIYSGYLSWEDCESIEALLAQDPDKYTINRDTQPYH